MTAGQLLAIVRHVAELVGQLDAQRPGLAQRLLRLPALAAGTAVGVMMFGRVNDVLFRRVVLAVLLVAGLFLVV